MEEAAPPVATGNPASVIIKKYANRRLYNTALSSYITLDHLAAMTREGRDFQVFDAKTGEDITRQVLAQIVMEGESNGQTMLPAPFLRQLIAMYGDSMQSMVPPYLEASMAAFAQHQAQFRNAVTGAFGGTAFKPFEALAKQNMAMLQATADLLTGRAPTAAKAEPAKAAPGELDSLKTQMAVLQAQLDRLAQG